MAAAGEQARARILRFLVAYHEQHGFFPSIREIVAACGFATTSVVGHHLRALEKAGYLVRLPGARAFRILRRTYPTEG
jgi:repressor LexA